MKPDPDEIERQRMEIFSGTLLDAIKSGAGPQSFQWREHVGGNPWEASEDPRDYRTLGLQRALQSQASKEAANERRVSRDPCPLCQTRRDIGCRHTGRKRPLAHDYLTKPELVNEAWDRELMLPRRGIA